MAAIYKMIYVSSAPYDMSDDELMEILTVSRKNNKEKGITGLLLYFDGSFFQLLEGDKESVTSLFTTIAQDRRHTGVIKLYEQVSETRDFPEWSMGFKRIDQNTLGDDSSGFLDLVRDSSQLQDLFNDVSSKTRLLIDTFKVTTGMNM